MYYTLCAIRFPVVNSNINLQGVLSMEEICLIKNWQLTIWNFYSCLKLLKESKKILKKRCENLFLRGRNCNENNESYGSSPPQQKQNKTKNHIFLLFICSPIFYESLVNVRPATLWVLSMCSKIVGMEERNLYGFLYFLFAFGLSYELIISGVFTFLVCKKVTLRKLIVLYLHVFISIFM